MNLAERLKACRKHKNKTQSDFAELVGVSKRSIVLYELEQRKPGFDAILGYYKQGFNIHWLLSGEGSMFFKNENFASNIELAGNIADLMILIYQTIDEYLDLNDREMEPTQKSKLAKSIYITLQQSGRVDFENAPSNVKSIIDIIKLVA